MLKDILSHFRDPPAMYLGDIARDYPALLARHLPTRCLVVGDINTLTAIGGALPFPAHCFAQSPAATGENVEIIRHASQQAEALIAIGSGTLNDLVKYAAFLDGKPYAVIATAPSMNGYVSANASISEGGYKHTLPARSPVAVLADSATLAAAPAALIQAGIGDTLCRSTLQADWLLSHLLLGTPYDSRYFEWMQSAETLLVDLIRARRGGDSRGGVGEDSPTARSAFINELFDCLTLSGLCMRDHGSSAPASQGEHMIAHCYEMMFPDAPHSYHGQQIAVTTLTMAAHQQRILTSPTPPRIAFGDPAEHLPPALRAEAAAQYAQKLPDATALNARLAKHWPEIAAQIRAVILPYETLKNTLEAANCPTTPEALGWVSADYSKAANAARFTRNRFTFLDLELA